MEKGGAPNLAELYKLAQTADEKSQASVLVQTVQRIFGGEKSVNNVFHRAKLQLKEGDIEGAYQNLIQNPCEGSSSLALLIEQHIFAAQFNSTLVDKLRQQYVENQTFSQIGRKKLQQEYFQFSERL